MLVDQIVFHRKLKREIQAVQKKNNNRFTAISTRLNMSSSEMDLEEGSSSGRSFGSNTLARSLRRRPSNANSTTSYHS